jgi:FAD:protein FMN transferase
MADLKRREVVMGTTIRIDVRRSPLTDVETGDVVERAYERLREIDRIFSTYKTDSDITRLGRGEITVAECHPDVAVVLELCDNVQRLTDGVFDIRRAATTPPSSELQPGGPRPDPIEPSGLVKGWAVERASEVLERAGLRDFCVSAGGDMWCSGEMEPGEAWRIGLQHPIKRDKIMAVLDVRDTAIATSGNYERGLHIVDSKGDAADELLSVSIIGREIVLADAYATTAFAMGRAGIDWIVAQEGFDVYAVDAEQQVHYSRGLDELIVPPATTGETTG